MKKPAQELVERIAKQLRSAGFKQRPPSRLATSASASSTRIRVARRLIVLGSHGTRGIQRFLLGSVAEFVARTPNVRSRSSAPRQGTDPRLRDKLARLKQSASLRSTPIQPIRRKARSIERAFAMQRGIYAIRSIGDRLQHHSRLGPVLAGGRHRGDRLHDLHPSTTSPKMVCLPVSQLVSATVMKNWLPLVFGPELAMASLPSAGSRGGESLSRRRTCSRATHSGALGSPAWIMKLGITRWKTVPSYSLGPFLERLVHSLVPSPGR